MKIARRSTLDEIQSSTWTSFAEEVGLAAPFVRRRVTELAAAVLAKSPAFTRHANLAALDARVLKEQASIVAKRAERVARTGA